MKMEFTMDAARHYMTHQEFRHAQDHRHHAISCVDSFQNVLGNGFLNRGRSLL